jgi:solute:Na+ symporter, SSS family
MNNMNESNRFLYSKDSKNARWAALLAALLFVVGPIIWFIPPMAARILYPDLNAIEALRPLKETITEGAYVGMGLMYLPKGMIGLMVSAIFAATMSPMDTGLNKNAGIFVRNFYKPIMRKHASDKEYLIAGKIVSFLFGCLIILAALSINTIKDYGLFNIMNQFSANITLPVIIPLIWGIIIKKTPSWSAWSTVLVGFTVSLFVLLANAYYPAEFQHLLGFASPLSKREAADFTLITSLFANVIVSSVWFIGTSFFAGFNKPEYTAQEDEFFQRMNTPLVTDQVDTREMDAAQYNKLAALCIPYGGFVMFLCVIPQEDLTGHMCFIFAGGIIAGLGLILWWKAKKTLA